MAIFYIISFFLQLAHFHKIYENFFVWTFPAFILFIFIFKSITSETNRVNIIVTKNKILSLVVLLIIIGMIRSNNPEKSEIYAFVKIFQFVGLLYATGIFFSSKNTKIEEIFLSIILPFTFLCILNILLWLLNIQRIDNESIDGTQAVLLSSIGIKVNRVSFPLGFGINNYGIVMGAILTISCIAIFILKKYKKILYLTIFVTFVSLLLLDSRACIFLPLITCFVCWISYQKNNIFIIKTLPYIAILGPILMVSLLPIISELDIISSFARNKQELANGNSRFLIWGIALSEFVSFKLEHIFGYGEYGHYQSGASLKWSDFFGGYEKNEVKSPHNSILSIIFDYGYIGLILYLLFLKDLVRKICALWVNYKGIAVIFAGFYIYTILIGITEITFGLYMVQFSYLFFSVTLSLYTLHELLTRKNQWKRNMNLFTVAENA